jgi:hypothetical protein
MVLIFYFLLLWLGKVCVVLTVLSNVVLVSLGGFEAGGTGDQLVDYGGIVLLGVGAVVLVVGLSLSGVVYGRLIGYCLVCICQYEEECLLSNQPILIDVEE